MERLGLPTLNGPAPIRGYKVADTALYPPRQWRDIRAQWHTYLDEGSWLEAYT